MGTIAPNAVEGCFIVMHYYQFIMYNISYASAAIKGMGVARLWMSNL